MDSFSSQKLATKEPTLPPRFHRVCRRSQGGVWELRQLRRLCSRPRRAHLRRQRVMQDSRPCRSLILHHSQRKLRTKPRLSLDFPTKRRHQLLQEDHQPRRRQHRRLLLESLLPRLRRRRLRSPKLRPRERVAHNHLLIHLSGRRDTHVGISPPRELESDENSPFDVLNFQVFATLVVWTVMTSASPRGSPGSSEATSTRTSSLIFVMCLPSSAHSCF